MTDKVAGPDGSALSEGLGPLPEPRLWYDPETQKCSSMVPLRPTYEPLWDEDDIRALMRELEAQRLYARLLCKAVDAATDFAGTVAGGASWWDDVWADHAAALDRARERITHAQGPNVRAELPASRGSA